MNILVLILIFFYIIKLINEKKELKKNRKKIKTIIHINGIRGKSTVCRLIDAGLRDGRNKVFTKVTGTSPKYISIDGIERDVKRKGKANIREQIKTIKKAADLGSDILILECMAVNPELQKICEEDILKANISVITNVRRDHLLEMGNSLKLIAKSLGGMICTNGIFVTGDRNYFKYFKRIASSKNTESYLSYKIEEEYRKIDFPENVALALKVCFFCGVKEQEALARMKNYKKDLGVLKGIEFKNKLKNNIYFLNAMAANDPDSTEKILEIYKNKEVWRRQRYLLVNNRKDRLKRLQQFSELAKKYEKDFNKIFISGESKRIFYKKTDILCEKLKIINGIEELDKLEKDSLVIAVGNICGKGKKLLEQIERRELI